MENIKGLKIKKENGSSTEYSLGIVTSVKGNDANSKKQTGDVVITKIDIGLEKVANTADEEKTVKNVSHKLTIGDKSYDGENAVIINKDDISNILGCTPVGGQGVNLLTGTKDFSGDNWNRRNIWNVENEQYNGLTVLSKGYEWGGIYQFFYAKAGETYTFSVYVKTDIPLSCYMLSVNSDETHTPEATIEGGGSIAISCTTEWKKYVRSVKVTKDGYLGFRIEKSDTSSNKIYVCGYKLEPGLVTDPIWTPAPEDLVVRSELSKAHVSKGRELPYTWNELRDMCNTGDFKDVQVGDYKTVTMKNKEIVVMEVAGIDTFYNTSGGETHGQFSTTEYTPVPHHIDFISKDCLSTYYQWNLDNHNWGDGTGDPDDGTDQPFLTSYIKKSVLDEIVYNNLPEDVKKVIISKINLLERRAKKEPALTTSTGWHWYNMGKLWLPSEFEIFGTNIWSGQGYGSTQAVQYPLFANSWEHRIKGKGHKGGRCAWWLCSVASGNSTACCRVTSAGAAYGNGASDSYGVPVCFRVAAKSKL